MKVITELKDVVKTKRFGSNILHNYSSDGILLRYNKDGLCTLISMKDFSYIYPGKWFKEWKNFKNDDSVYIVTNSDNLKTLIKKMDHLYIIIHGMRIGILLNLVMNTTKFILIIKLIF